MFGQRGSLINSLYPLAFFDDGDGGGLGDVADIPLGHSGDVEILERGAEDDADQGDASDDAAEGSAGKGKGKEEPGKQEEFDKEDEDADDKGDEDKDNKEDEDKEEETTDVFEGRPTLKDLKASYPDIFKKYPELREVLFREQKFGEQFGSVEEAQQAAVKARSFDVIETNLLDGDSSLLIEQLGENDPQALAKVVDNFLPTVLEKGGQDLYLRATVPIIETFLANVFEHGKRVGDKNLMASAKHASNYIFGTPDIRDPSRRQVERGPHPAEKKLEEERKQWNQTRFQEASSEVSAEIDTVLEAEIAKGLDPDKVLSPRQRVTLIREIKDAIDEQLSKDTAFGRQMKSLWQQATTSGYSKDKRTQIKNAFLGRAKALVPGVRSRLRAEWLGEKPEKSSGKSEKEEKPAPRKRDIPETGRAAAERGKTPPRPSEVDYNRTSDMDLIEGRFTRKRA